MRVEFELLMRSTTVTLSALALALGSACPAPRDPVSLETAASMLEPQIVTAIEPSPPLEQVRGLQIAAEAMMEPPGRHRLSDVRQVVVRFKVTGERGPRQAAVEFIRPDGMSYERRLVTLVSDGVTPQLLEFTLPVAGTLVATAGLAGTWTAKMFIGAQSVAEVAVVLTR